ncbi:ATP-binding protein [Corallococcus sp. M34]|uniref:ATP-binding protein n=1 Tax=Citreicoccus inhibens TaxID=2849499 RepID=UPI001C23DB35|nr:ATP-binding protein [Citreicoccus inhibens]MBU8897187.1 ATP-binding protein [Citreicoccus inhibens]
MLQGSLEDVVQAEDAVRGLCEDSGYGRHSFGMCLAVSECVINAIRHGNAFDPGKQVHLSMTLAGSRLTVRVADEGKGFTPEASSFQDAGRGVLLMKTLMDDVAFAFRGGAGFEVQMYKDLAA